MLVAAWATTPTVTVPHPRDWAHCFEQISLTKSPEADKILSVQIDPIALNSDLVKDITGRR
jgi:hypothetical protein